MFALVRGQVKEYLEEGMEKGLIKFHSKSNIIIIITIVKVRSPPIISNYEAVEDEEKVFIPQLSFVFLCLCFLIYRAASIH